MGQKVNPVGFRLKVVPKILSCRVINPHFRMQDLRGWDSYLQPSWICRDFGRMHQEHWLLIKKVGECLFKTSFFMNRCIVKRTSSRLVVDIYALPKSSLLNFSESVDLKVKWSVRGVSLVGDSSSYKKAILSLLDSLSHQMPREVTSGVPICFRLHHYSAFLKQSSGPLAVLDRVLHVKGNSLFRADFVRVLFLCTQTPSSGLLAGFLVDVLGNIPKRQSFKQRTAVSFVTDSFAVALDILPLTSVRLCGVCVQVKGRLNGVDMSQRLFFRTGVMPLHTQTLPVDYSFREALTFYGIYGVKVWFSYK
jgi:hypothetical protein